MTATMQQTVYGSVSY